MSSPNDNADFDALVSVIKMLQESIKRDHDTLGVNEIRTRTALIDPLLSALGWDTTNPARVIPEYPAGNGFADYALLETDHGGQQQPIAFIEAKRLNENLRNHRAQMLTYSNMEGVKYAGLTNGDRWELYEVFKEAPLAERCIFSISISRQSAFDCAGQLLRLKRSNLGTGEALSPQDNEAVDVAEAPAMDVSKTLIWLSVVLLVSGAAIGYGTGFWAAQPVCDGFASVGALAVGVAVIAAVAFVFRWSGRRRKSARRSLQLGRMLWRKDALIWSSVALAVGGIAGYVVGLRTAQPVCDALAGLGTFIVAIAIVGVIGWLVIDQSSKPQRGSPPRRRRRPRR